MSNIFIDNKKLCKYGFIKHEFNDKSKKIINTLNLKLLWRLKTKWNINLISLNSYHKVVLEDSIHTAIQSDLSSFINSLGLVRKIIESDNVYFQNLIGPDLCIQKFPYLRIARPNLYQDNIGFHRDTHYGSSPYEVSIHIPITNVGLAGSLSYLPGSNTASDIDFPFTKVKSDVVSKGSAKHKLGFLYEPKVLDQKFLSKIKPISVKPGNAMIFALGLIHGQVVNNSNISRFSVDIRLVNSFAPVNWQRNVHSDYYEKFSESGITAQAKLFLANNL